MYAGDTLGMHGDFSTNRLVSVPDLGPLIPGSRRNAGIGSDRDDHLRGHLPLALRRGRRIELRSERENADAYARFGYNALDGQTSTIGLITSPDLAKSAPLVGRFNDTNTYSADARLALLRSDRRFVARLRRRSAWGYPAA